MRIDPQKCAACGNCLVVCPVSGALNPGVLEEKVLSAIVRGRR
jgi:ferredoxin